MHGAVSVPCFHERPMPKIPATPILPNLGSPCRGAKQASSPAFTFKKRLKGSRPAQILLVFTRRMRLVLQKKRKGLSATFHVPFPIVRVGKEWGIIVSNNDIITSYGKSFDCRVEIVPVCSVNRDFRPSLLAIKYSALSPVQTSVLLESYWWTLLLWSKRTWPESRSPKL